MSVNPASPQILSDYGTAESTFTVPGREPKIADRTRYFGCDTEVAFIEVKEQSPVGHGAVICFSVYGGPDINFNMWVSVWGLIAGICLVVTDSN